MSNCKKTDKVVSFEKNDDSSLKIFFESGKTGIFKIQSIFDSNLSQPLKKRWENMFNSGSFFNVEISLGDLVWPGWVELFHEELDDFIS